MFTVFQTRLWRKSRSTPPEGCNCYGVDLNRNFDALWGSKTFMLKTFDSAVLSFYYFIMSLSLLSLIAVGVSSDCCAFNYPGTAAVSEKESQALTAFLSNRTDEILCYFTIHSYGQQILIPYGHPHVSAPNYKELVTQDHM